MIDAIITGRLYGLAEEHESKSGQHYVRAKLATPDGKAGVVLFVGITAFNKDACVHLLGLRDHDGLSVSGQLTPTAWIDKDGKPRAGLNMLAHSVMSARPVD